MFEHFRPTRTGHLHASLSDLSQAKVQYIPLGLPTFYFYSTLCLFVNWPCMPYESLVDRLTRFYLMALVSLWLFAVVHQPTGSKRIQT